MKSLSIVVPMYKEEDCVFPLVERVHEALSDYAGKWELVCVDDGSPDQTVARLNQAQEQWGDHLRVVELQRNFGQTAAMQAGIDAADRKSTRLNSSHRCISYAVFCLKKKKI